MIEWAEKYVGIPYLLHSRSIENCDCYGLICLIYKNELNIELPLFDEFYNDNANDREILKLFEENRKKWKQVYDKKIGDIVYFVIAGLEKHVGLLVGDNCFIHNLRQGGSSTLANLNSPKWRRRIVGIYRYE